MLFENIINMDVALKVCLYRLIQGTHEVSVPVVIGIHSMFVQAEPGNT